MNCSAQANGNGSVEFCIGTSKVVCEYLSGGDSYINIRKIISISIVFFDLGEGKDYLYKGSTTFKGIHYGDELALNSKEKEAYGEVHYLNYEKPETIFPEYYIIKVTQFKEKVKDKLDEWIYLFKNGKVEKNFTAKGYKKRLRH